MIRLILGFLRAFILPRTALAAENLALRHQLGVLRRSVNRPKLRKRDRIFWVWLSRLWADWRSCLMIVKPKTVVRWHRQGFRLYWRWKSRTNRRGRPRTAVEIRQLIQRTARENPTWGAPRIEFSVWTSFSVRAGARAPSPAVFVVTEVPDLAPQIDGDFADAERLDLARHRCAPRRILALQNATNTATNGTLRDHPGI